MNDERLYERFVRRAIKVLMEELQVTGVDLAERLGTVPGDVSRHTTPNIESKSSRAMTLDKTWAYASALGVSVDRVIDKAEELMAQTEALWVDDVSANGG